MPIKIVRKHAWLARWNHWINFPVLSIMVWSGFMIYWAHPAYFIPQSWMAFLGLNGRLAEGLSWHLTFGWIFAINGLCYLLFLLISKNWRFIAPTRGTLTEAAQVAAHDLGLRRETPPRPVKYNGAQRIAYSCAIVLGILGVWSGFAIHKPVQLGFLTALLGGYTPARLIHFLVALGFLGFFVVHVIQVIRAGWNGFRAMITGWEVEDEQQNER